MKAITVSQPHASKFFDPDDLKWVENRPKDKPWVYYRGLLLIHAGKGTQYLTKKELAAHPTGAILGVVRLETVIHISHLQRAPRGIYVDDTRRTVGEVLDHKHTCGPYLLIVGNARKFRVPIPYVGALGLFEVPDALVSAAIEEAEVIL